MNRLLKSCKYGVVAAIGAVWLLAMAVSSQIVATALSEMVTFFVAYFLIVGITVTLFEYATRHD